MIVTSEIYSRKAGPQCRGFEIARGSWLTVSTKLICSGEGDEGLWRPEASHQFCRVATLCTNVVGRPLHSRDLHSMIVAAFQCSCVH